MPAIHSDEPRDPAQSAASSRPTPIAGRRRRIAWAVVGLVVVFVLGLSVFGIVARKPCASCHDLGAFRAQTQASPHASVDCRRCHMAPGALGQVAFALQRPLHVYVAQARTTDRDAAGVPDARCRECHSKEIQGVITSNGIRLNHTSCSVGASCSDCHSSIAHGSATLWVRSYDMDVCLECHLKSGKVQCNLCHEGRDTAARVKFGAFAVTHGPKWKTTHAMGDTTTCTVCHQARDCVECHGVGVPHEANFVEAHSLYADQADERCGSCHEDTFCTGCHGMQMPHPAGFTRRHTSLAASQPDQCKRCHEDSDCTNCHVMHVHPGGAVGMATTQGGGQ